MKKLIIAITISLIVGFAAASWMETSLVSTDTGHVELPAAVSFDAAAPVEERIRALEQAVMQEQQARQLLEDELFVLREEFEQRDAAEAESLEQSIAAQQEARQSFRSRRFGGGSTAGRVERLIQAGFPPDRAEWIMQREAEIQMEGIQARYEAMRGAEDQMAISFGRAFAQNDALRAELGEADYERYLTANGQSTTVGVGSVIANSPAQRAGLQPGDQIVRYDGERVFSMMDVAGRVMQGEPDGTVVVDIMRDGIAMQLVLPRGPLGVMGN